MPFPNKATYFKSGEKQVKRARKGGKKGGIVRNDKKKLSAKLRWMKERGITKKQLETFELAMHNPDVCGGEYMQLVERYEQIARKEGDSDMLKSAAMLKSKAYDMFHKDKGTQVNIQINSIMTDEKKDTIIARLIKE